MIEPVIVDAIRTARGKRKGALAQVHPVDLLARTLNGALERANVKPQDVDDVIMGCVTQVGEQGFNVARGAVLAAGLPVEIPGTTVNRFCGSGLQAVNFAAQAVLSGAAQLVLAGGVEHMTRVPMGSDAVGGDGPASPGLVERWPNLVPQGLSAEMIAAKWGYSRRQLDEFAAHSQHKAANAIERGYFTREILPLKLGEGTFDRDEHPRPGTTADTLAALKPSFKEDGVLHAGNSSGMVDGAAVVVVASKGKARSLGLKPRARIVSMAVAGSDPVLMLTGPIPSTRKALAQADLKVSDIDVFEINEAFAPVPILVAQELGIPMEKVNPNGGAIALGHPLGATGAILLASALHELERTGQRRALITLCIGYGMGITTIIDRKVD
ncbi:MAG TPA: thiolase family protein [Myxococcales bacterium]|nr:thiolase family protein [Myxococcales bacterium]HET9751820.1 thiolase family protein [Myxococcales bacterium]